MAETSYADKVLAHYAPVPEKTQKALAAALKDAEAAMAKAKPIGLPVDAIGVRASEGGPSTLSITPPAGTRLVTAPADHELAKTARAIAGTRGVSFDEGMRLALAEDPALSRRYDDFRNRTHAIKELERFATRLHESGRAPSFAAAVPLALSEDADLSARVAAYFQPIPAT